MTDRDISIALKRVPINSVAERGTTSRCKLHGENSFRYGNEYRICPVLSSLNIYKFLNGKLKLVSRILVTN